MSIFGQFCISFDFYRAMLCIRGTSHGLYLSVCVCVCLTQTAVLLKRQKRRITQQHYTIVQGILYIVSSKLK